MTWSVKYVGRVGSTVDVAVWVTVHGANKIEAKAAAEKSMITTFGEAAKRFNFTLLGIEQVGDPKLN